MFISVDLLLEFLSNFFGNECHHIFVNFRQLLFVESLMSLSYMKMVPVERW